MTRLKKISGMLAVVPILCLTLAGCVAPTLTVEITSPQDGVTVTESLITVNGNVSDAKAMVSITCEAPGVKPEVNKNIQGIEVAQPVEVAADGSFSAQVKLSEGANTIEVIAVLGKQEVSDKITVNYALAAPALSLEISSPPPGATTSGVMVEGSVSAPAATITVNGEEVEVVEDGSFSAKVELTYGENTITVAATLEGYEPATKIITVTRVLAIDIISPENGAELIESPVIATGWVTDSEATVTVNGAEVEVAADGSFSAQVKLSEGENTIEAVAVLSKHGYESKYSIIVTYIPAE